MKKIFVNTAILLFLSFTLLGCAQNSKSEDKEGLEVVLISAKDLNTKLGDIQLIDVRTAKEYKDGHLKNAVNIDYFGSHFMDEINKLDKNKPIYVYCQVGGRSGKAAEKLKSQGFVKIYDLKGGFSTWRNNNLEFVK